MIGKSKLDQYFSIIDLIGHSGVWVGINMIDNAATNFNCGENKIDADEEMIELHEHNSCSEEIDRKSVV